MGIKQPREPGTCPVCGYYLMTHEVENGLCGYCVERLQSRPLHAEIEKKKGICVACHIRTAQPGKLICKTCAYTLSRYQLKKVFGKCGKCGNPNDNPYGLRCLKCVEKEKQAYRRKRYEQKRAKERCEEQQEKQGT